MTTKANLKANVPVGNEYPNIKNYEWLFLYCLFIFISSL